jgi:glycosyltransferase involved in cell wall biosynthesis
LRLLVVSSQFPIAGDPLRGRPILQTVRELARLAQVSVVSPVAVYPAWAQPGSYAFHAPNSDYQPLCGVSTRYVPYKAFPKLSRAFNGDACAKVLLRDIPNDRYDLVLGYWIYPDCYGALRWAQYHGVPIICGARGSDLLVTDTLSRRQTALAVSGADRVLTVSRQLGDSAVTEFGAHRDRLAVIPNGCDTEIFCLRDRAAARAQLDLPEEKLVVFYVGRLVAEKGLRELVEASAQLAKQRPQLLVALAGNGPMQDELTALIRETEAPVRLLGQTTPADIAQWMAAANLVTLPSYSEGNPNVILEALACGRAVLATRVGGIVEATDADNAVLVEARSIEALRAGMDLALDRVWNEPAIAARHARSWGVVAAETLAECERARRLRQAS